MFEEYYAFTETLEKANIARTTLYRLIKDNKIRVKEFGKTKLYLLKDVINNKPRKK